MPTPWTAVDSIWALIKLWVLAGPEVIVAAPDLDLRDT